MQISSFLIAYKYVVNLNNAKMIISISRLRDKEVENIWLIVFFKL